MNGRHLMDLSDIRSTEDQSLIKDNCSIYGSALFLPPDAG